MKESGIGEQRSCQWCRHGSEMICTKNLGDVCGVLGVVFLFSFGIRPTDRNDFKFGKHQKQFELKLKVNKRK